MKYKCLIVDDQLIQRDTIEMDLLKTGRVDVVATCADGLEASVILAEQEVDIVFSDIDMPNLNGPELLRSLRNPPVFVFITSHEEYAVESFELDVVDFVMKPFTFERILRATNKAIEYLEMKTMAETKKASDALADKIADDLHFFIRENHDLIKLKYEDVIYIESMGHFSKIFTVSDKKHITLVGLKNLEQLLPQGMFTRVHKQYMINHKHINVIGQGDITLAGKHRVPVGLSYRSALLEQVVSNKTITRF